MCVGVSLEPSIVIITHPYMRARVCGPGTMMHVLYLQHDSYMRARVCINMDLAPCVL